MTEEQWCGFRAQTTEVAPLYIYSLQAFEVQYRTKTARREPAWSRLLGQVTNWPSDATTSTGRFLDLHTGVMKPALEHRQSGCLAKQSQPLPSRLKVYVLNLRQNSTPLSRSLARLHTAAIFPQVQTPPT